MTTLQTEFSESELLADHDIVEPLVAQGVAAMADSTNRVTTSRRVRRTVCRPSRPGRNSGSKHFSTPIIDVPLDTWPENFPNVEQSKFLIRRGGLNRSSPG